MDLGEIKALWTGSSYGRGIGSLGVKGINLGIIQVEWSK